METKESKTNNTKTVNTKLNNTKEEVAMSNTEDKIAVVVQSGVDPKFARIAARISSKPIQRKTSNSAAASKLRQAVISLLETGRVGHGVTHVTFGDVVTMLQDPEWQIAYAWAIPMFEDGKPVIDKMTKEPVLKYLSFEEMEEAVKAGMPVIEHPLLGDQYRDIMQPLRRLFLDLRGKPGSRVGKLVEGCGLPKGWAIHYVEGGKGDDKIAFVFKG